MAAIFASEYYQISFILILAAFAIPISRKASVAEIPILIILGILFGPVLGVIDHQFAINLMSQFGTVGIGLLGLMIILYYESHNINLRVLRRHFWRIISLDTIGIVLTAIVAGLFFSLITGAPFGIGFLFGAIISPTDPVTIIPLFRRINLKEDISGTLIGESLFNDPLGIILVTIAIVLIAPDAATVSLFTTLAKPLGMISATFIYFIMQISVPSVIGIAIGFSVIYLNKILNFENLIVGLLLGIVILEFTLLEAMSITPFPAIIATGAIVGNFSDKSIFWNRETNFQENLSFLAQAIIFLLLGSMMTQQEMLSYFFIGFALAMVVIFLTRPLAVFSSLFIIRTNNSETPMNNRIRAFFSLVGPRGVVSVVMSTVPYVVGLTNNIPTLIKWGPLINVSVSFVVLFSIVLQTIYIPLISTRLITEPRKIKPEAKKEGE